MEFLNVLSREEMKNVKGGGSCRIATRNADGSFAGYLPGCHSYGTASSMYDSGHYDNDSSAYVSGYCCASCGSGGFSHATPCLQ